MAERERVICRSEALREGQGLRFDVQREGKPQAAFLVRHRGVCRGYLNECPHARTELDWEPGEFFDGSGLYLICATHGAMFDPDSGYCIDGPCRGRSLLSVAVTERGGEIHLEQG